MEQRANIKFCFKLGKKFAQTYGLLKKVYGDDCMSRTRVYTWFTWFKSGRDDLNDDPRPRRPEASNRAELVEKVREIIAIDANFTVRMLAEELNSSYCIIYRILSRDLGKRKVCARFVSHHLNEDKKSQRIFEKKKKTDFSCMYNFAVSFYIILRYIRLVHFILKFQILMRLENLLGWQQSHFALFSWFSKQVY